MDKIRFIGDMHVDINRGYPLELADKDVFTVVCGDTAGETEEGIEWIRKNVRRGVIVSGNHMPYRNATRPVSERKTMAEFREWLKNEFPINSDVSYLDAETDNFYKEVDGILFVGSCFYSNFSISEPRWNPNGDQRLNMACSEFNMNDYKYGYVERTFSAETGNIPSYKRMKPDDLNQWFCNAYKKIDGLLCENEALPNPKPVVLATHYPLVTDYLTHTGYVERSEDIYRQREFNWSSYASDMKAWLKRHSSIKVYASGHIHDVDRDYRYYSVKRDGTDDLLLMHNVRGYVGRGHARWFNPDTFVDTATWKAYERELMPDEDAARAEPGRAYLEKCAAWGMF